MKKKYLFISLFISLLFSSLTGQEKNVFKMNASLGIHWDGLYPTPDDVRINQSKIESVDLSETLPRDENAITALAIGRDNLLYGATSGKKSHLFTYNKEKKCIVHLGRIGEDPAVYHSLVFSNDGDLFIGTTNWTDPSGISVSTEFPGGWPQSGEIKNQPVYSGGHLYVYSRNTKSAKKDMENSPLVLTDLGIPVKGEGIYNLSYDPVNDRVYGLTIPRGVAFFYDIPSEETVILGETTSPNYLPPYTFVSRSLVAIDGNVYGSGLRGELFKIDGISGTIEKNTGMILPCIKGREFLNVADILLPSGSLIFGGSSEGYLFSCDPSGGIVVNLGRPYRENRIRAMVKGKDENFYLIAGHPEGICQFFAYNTKDHSFESFGLIEDVEGNWLGYQFDAMAIDEDETIFIGESSSKSHLFILTNVNK